jgi:hypothetical protein
MFDEHRFFVVIDRTIINMDCNSRNIIKAFLHVICPLLLIKFWKIH